MARGESGQPAVMDMDWLARAVDARPYEPPIFPCSEDGCDTPTFGVFCLPHTTTQ